MKRLILILFAVVLVIAGCQAGQKKEKKVAPVPEEKVVEETVPASTPAAPAPKRVLMVIAHEDFRDEEYSEPRGIFEGQGMQVTVASSSLEPAKGSLGLEVKPDLLLEQANVADYDAIIFVGGVGSVEYWHDENAHFIAQRAVNSDKVLAAICIAPVTLANAGVLEGKQATVWSSRIQEITEKGAQYVDAPVVRDGNIVTASGPKAAGSFAQTIVQALGEQQ